MSCGRTCVSDGLFACKDLVPDYFLLCLEFAEVLFLDGKRMMLPNAGDESRNKKDPTRELESIDRIV